MSHELPPVLPGLRQDLVFALDDFGEQCEVTDPQSGRRFEFGREECFLLSQLRSGSSVKQICAHWQTAFHQELTEEDLGDFVEVLVEWGLIENRGPQEVAEPLHGSDNGDAIVVASQRPNRWHLFYPEPLFRSLGGSLRPLRFLVYTLPIVVAFSIIGLIFNAEVLADRVSAAMASFGIIGRLIVSGFTINLFSQVMRGIVACYYDMRVPSFGLVLAVGLIPRFNVQLLPHGDIKWAGRLWLTATSALVRVCFFVFGAFLWLSLKNSGGVLPSFGVELALLSLIGLALGFNPFWGEGYAFTSLLLRSPNLKERGKNAILALFVKRPEVIAKHARHSFWLALFFMLSSALMIAVIGFVGWVIVTRLEREYHGTGVAVFVVTVSYILFSLRRQNRFQDQHTQGGQPPKQGAKKSTGATDVGIGEKRAPGVRPIHRSGSIPGSESHVGPLWKRLLRYAILATLAASLFLPYRYHAGGELEILPSARLEITAEVDGLVEEVYFFGGEWVVAGTEIARLSDYRQQKDVLATQASIAAKISEIEILRTTPSAEEIEFAQAQIVTARLRLKYSAELAERYEPLYEKGAVSAEIVKAALEERDLDQQSVAEKLANLAALKAKVNPNQIHALEIEVDALREELRFFEEELRRTRLRAPIDGRLITMDLKNLQNKFVEEGDVLAEIEDASEVKVEISVPEFDADEVEVGRKVLVKTWAQSNATFVGTISEIYPTASEKEYGPTITAVAVLANEQGRLKAGLTGYGKIEGSEMVVITAFSRFLVRFFLVEVWSWIP